MSDKGASAEGWLEPPGQGQQLPVGEAVDPFTVLRPEQGNLAALKGYLYNSLQGLSRIPGDIGAAVGDFSRNVAVPYLENYGKVPEGPLLALGQGGTLEGRLPALASAVAPFIAGAAPPGALGAGNRLPGGRTGGWHGTPHLFEAEEGAPLGRFRNEAIGSGEGAQAYGWGHYVAGKQEVGEEYQRGLAGPGNTTIGGVPWMEHPDVNAFNPHIQTAVNEINAAEGNTVRATDQLTNHTELLNRQMAIKPEIDDPFLKGEVSRLNNARQWIIDNEHQIGWQPGGALLEVHILPEEHELLDWDKPLAEQPDAVKAAISKHAVDKRYVPANSSFEPGSEWAYFAQKGSGDGRSFYERMTKDNGSAQAASAALHEVGIPGIRYLDQGSRVPPPPVEEIEKGIQALQQNPLSTPEMTQKVMAGLQKQLEISKNWTPTHNYVIFHPDNLRITARNGQRLEPVDHDPFGGQ